MHLAISDAVLRHKSTAILSCRNGEPCSTKPGPDEKQCKCCGHIFPATLEFFFSHHRRIDGTAVLGPKCRACSYEPLNKPPKRPPSATRELHRILHLFSLPMSNASHLTAYVWSLDGEDFPYESLENLLSANPTLSAGSTVFYGVPVAPVPADFVDASRIFQDIQADAQAAFGDCAKDYAKTVAPEAMADLQNMLEAWLLESLGLPNCYSVTHVASYSISSHDLP